ncbi:MAG: CPBP family glutamic-type intramembrane protease, partial [Planctomycetota bacterium]|nr:CPBP family glutamic-type intramembrane protease [Planctomycetota bacterium]
LLPFLVFYEFCLIFILRRDGGATVTNWAHEALNRYLNFAIPDVIGLSFPAIAIVVVLLVWHALTRASWRLRPDALGFMFLEAIAWTVPLVVFSRVVHQIIPLIAGQDPVIADLGPMGKLAISIGAGLYEELVFRMLLIFLIHTLLVDAFRLPGIVGSVVAVVVSAILFTIYHPLEGVDGSLSLARLAFFMVAGLFFGAIFILRGFGIVVATHAFYDIFTFFASD